VTAPHPGPRAAAGGAVPGHDVPVTPLGPVDGWPEALRTALAIVLDADEPMVLWAGEELVALPNDAFAALRDDRLPPLRGRRGADALPGSWATVGAVLRGVLGGAPPARLTGRQLLRDGAAPVDGERGTWSCSPVRDRHGRAVGVLTTAAGPPAERVAALREGVRTDLARSRRAAETAAARLRATVEGLAAIVWEADWTGDGLRYTFVNDRAEELLGHPASEFVADPGLWPRLVHPVDRPRVLARMRDRITRGADFDTVHREVAIDGRVVWLHHAVHVVPGAPPGPDDPDGTPTRAQGVAVDVTRQRRAERITALLAEAGHLVADDGTAEEKLAALAALVHHDLGDGVIVSLVGPDGLLHRVAAVHDDAELLDRIGAIAPTRLTDELAATVAAGRPFVVPVTPELNRAVARDRADAAARDALGAGSVLAVPLVVDGEAAGLIGFLSTGRTRHHDEQEIDLAAELGRRVSQLLAVERARTREQHLRLLSADLASAGGVAEAAQRLVGRLSEALGAQAMSVYLVDREHGLHLVHGTGYASALLRRYAVVRPDADLPIAQAARTGAPIWLGTRRDWAGWEDLLEHAVAAGRHASATLPLVVGGVVVGVVGLSFATERAFPPSERAFVQALVAQAAPALERAATADERRAIADVLQHSLLPQELTDLPGLALAARYLPAAHGTQAGGDWYDVIPLPAGAGGRDRVAVAVGDVVGQGARAAAIMGQLRSALSAYLLEGHSPATALERLDRFAARVPGAQGSTATCLVLDPGSGELEHASAGHLPPLVTGPGGARLLDGATGTVLAVRGRPPFVPARARLEPGESVLLYTDGLVERRDEVVDAGLDRLVEAASAAQALAPSALVGAVLRDVEDAGTGAGDDVALVVVRRLPGPLRLDLPAEPERLRGLRRAVAAWAATVGLVEDQLYDLQLALGEAAANSVEHAYRDAARPGRVQVELERLPGGAVRVAVRDQGRWRPAPEDKGHRGRGLDLVHELGTAVAVRRGDGGTEVEFELAGSPVAGRVEAPAAPAAAAPAVTDARLVVDRADAPVRVVGDLDLAGVQAVRASLQTLLSAAAVPRVDLTGVTYLGSTGMAMLLELAELVPGRLQVVVTPGGAVRRSLVRSGLDRALEVVEPA
jgi:anti-anti-sigma factor